MLTNAWVGGRRLAAGMLSAPLLLALAACPARDADAPAAAALVHAGDARAGAGAAPADGHDHPHDTTSHLALRHAIDGTPDAQAECSCDGPDGWCHRHARGRIAGIAVDAPQLFDFIDPHGHDIRAGTLDCGACRDARASDGFCTTCQFGFVGGQLYATSIAHAFAKGRPVRADAVTCAVCRAGRDDPAWCEEGTVGVVGPRVFATPEEFERARWARALLLRSAELTRSCQTCAILHLAGGHCADCDATWPRTMIEPATPDRRSPPEAARSGP